MVRHHFLLGCLLLVAAGNLHAQSVPAREVLGAAHVGGKYSFTEEDYLNEGADRLLALGTRVIKVWLNPATETTYRFNSDWGPEVTDAVELVQKPYYQELFAKPFKTFILVVLPATGTPDFLDGMSAEETAAERDQMYRLAKHFLTTYSRTDKTFILQNWEGDHLLRKDLPEHVDPDEVRVRGMLDWFNARQNGVEDARREVAERDVEVYHAIEVNWLRPAMEGRVTLTNDVVPHTRADLYSYSSWEIQFDRRRLTKVLDYLEKKAPDNRRFGSKNIYLGEFGAAKDHVGGERRQSPVIRGLAEAALGWGVRYAVYWQVYCNEAARVYRGRPKNRDMRGFWLIRPDGTRAAMWNDMEKLLDRSLAYVSLASSSGQYLGAHDEDDEADGVSAGQWTRGHRETFALVDWNGGALDSGDRVSFLTHDGFYLTAETLDGRISARSEEAGEAETFILRKAGEGDGITLEAASGRFLGAEVGGEARAERWTPGPAETFLLQMTNVRPKS